MQSSAHLTRYLGISIAIVVFLTTVIVSPISAFQPDQTILPVSSPIVGGAGSTSVPLYYSEYFPLANPITVPIIPIYTPGFGSSGQAVPVSPFQAYIPESPVYTPLSPVSVPLVPIFSGDAGYATPILPAYPSNGFYSGVYSPESISYIKAPGRCWFNDEVESEENTMDTPGKEERGIIWDDLWHSTHH